MESWNNIIHTALLGTEKKTLQKEDVEIAIAECFEMITQQTSDKEEVFLQTASLLYNYRQCGFLPVKKETASLSQAEIEEKNYASSIANIALQDIVDTGSYSLLQFWLEQCSAAHKIIQPEFVPTLLFAGGKNKELRELVKLCCGKRGEWLVQFNEEWKWNKLTNDEDLWQTGTLAQRKMFLATTRENDSAKGRELLQQTWAQESAANKTELIEQLSINAGNEDVPWLEELLNEKSVKVKEAVLQLLKTIPSSSIVKQYQEILKKSIRLTTSKGILGIGSKTSLEIKLAAVDASIYKTGIQQLPSQANITDEEFILYQLAGCVPPHFWEEHLALNAEGILKLFLKQNDSKALIPAIGLAAIRFKQTDWLRLVMNADEGNIYPEAFKILSQKEAENYALKFLTNDNTAASVLQNISQFKDEWSIQFTKAILAFTTKNGYQYHKGFYNDIIHLLPVSIMNELEKFIPKEEHLRSMWSNISEHITKLLTLKLQTIKAFNE